MDTGSMAATVSPAQPGRQRRAAPKPQDWRVENPHVRLRRSTADERRRTECPDRRNEPRPPRTYSPQGLITGSDGREMIALTAGEARRLFNHATRNTRDTGHHQNWSDWRRAHQATARRCHYARRLNNHRLLL